MTVVIVAYVLLVAVLTVHHAKKKIFPHWITRIVVFLGWAGLSVLLIAVPDLGKSYDMFTLLFATFANLIFQIIDFSGKGDELNNEMVIPD